MCSRPNLWPIQLHCSMKEIHLGFNLHGEGHWRFSNSFFQKASYKSLYSNGCQIILILNSKMGHATSTHMSTAASVLTKMNASAACLELKKESFLHPRPSQMHTSFAACQIPRDRHSPDVNRIAMQLHGFLIHRTQ